MTKRELRELIGRVRSNKYLMRSETDYIIKALEEVQQYRAIGTAEECRKSVEIYDREKHHTGGHGRIHEIRG